MKIFKIRNGFATASSSVHSIVKGAKKVFNRKIYGADFRSRYEYQLTTPKEKSKFMLSILYENMKRIDNIDEVILREYSLDGNLWKSKNSYDDSPFDIHGPGFCIPTIGKHIPDIDMKFFEEFYEYVVNNPDVHVIGCGDEQQKEYSQFLEIIKDHQLIFWDFLRGAAYSKLCPLCHNSQGVTKIIAKKEGEFWILFDQESGKKIRFSFQDNSTEEYLYSRTPELVDLKITSVCNNNCPWCYETSSSDGKNCDELLFNQVCDLLEDMKVFEAAIGGGEPCLHPGFRNIVWGLNDSCIVPNFTTSSIDWLKFNGALNYIGGIGYSPKLLPNQDFLHDIGKIGDWREFSGRNNEVNMHLIDKIHTPYYKTYLELARDNGFDGIVLLGFKRTVNNKDFTVSKEIPITFYDVLELAEIYGLSVSVDTSYAKVHKQELEASDISEICYEVEEGKFSLYIDLVDKKWGKNSYCDIKFPWENVSDLRDQIEKNFPFI